MSSGSHVYTADSRFSILNRPGSPDWILMLKSPQLHDSGTYECQVPSLSFFLIQEIYTSEKLHGNKIQVNSKSMHACSLCVWTVPEGGAACLFFVLSGAKFSDAMITVKSGSGSVLIPRHYFSFPTTCPHWNLYLYFFKKRERKGNCYVYILYVVARIRFTGLRDDPPLDMNMLIFLCPPAIL